MSEISRYTKTFASLFGFISAHQERYLEALQELVRIPSVTTDLDSCQACAELLAKIAQNTGINARLDQYSANTPIIFSRSAPSSNAPILIGYGHYDVKPPGDLRLWKSDPWDAIIRDKRIYGRGVVDNKSGCLAFIFAVEACLKTVGLPVDIRLVFEGEEETGSDHLEDWILSHETDIGEASGLFCMDGAVNATGLFPRIDLFGRGILYLELSVQTADSDIHSSRAVLSHNAAWRLIEALGTVKDIETDKVIIPGWSDELMELTESDLEYFRERLNHFQEKDIRTQYGLRLPGYPGGRKSENLIQAYYAEPTCTICGFWSGNIEPDIPMTIIPSKATVKLDFRCPPNLQPEKQLKKLRDHLTNAGFPDVRVKVLLSRGYTWHTSHRSTLVRAIQQAGIDAFGEKQNRLFNAPTQEGVFYQNYNIPPVLTGFANPDCNIHAPNENLKISNYIKGIQYTAAIFHRFSQIYSEEEN
jgi:acetylornithine deacetylase/succinyl-diaminopimelate desuccinylase-like protein